MGGLRGTLLPPNNRWRGPCGAVCLTPRARGDSVRPGRVSGVVTRPLNFTVRPHVILLRLTLPLALAVWSLHSGPVPAQALGAATQAVLAAEDQRVDAMVRGDTAALRSLLADGLTYTHSDGAQQSKAELLQTIGSGALRYQSITHEGRVVRVRDRKSVVEGGRGAVCAVGGGGGEEV